MWISRLPHLFWISKYQVSFTGVISSLLWEYWVQTQGEEWTRTHLRIVSCFSFDSNCCQPLKYLHFMVRICRWLEAYIHFKKYIKIYISLIYCVHNYAYTCIYAHMSMEYLSTLVLQTVHKLVVSLDPFLSGLYICLGCIIFWFFCSSVLLDGYETFIFSSPWESVILGFLKKNQITGLSSPFQFTELEMKKFTETSVDYPDSF